MFGPIRNADNKLIALYHRFNMCRRIDSPLEYGYGNRHIAVIRAIKTIAMIAIPHRTNDGGISPISCLTFSERSSILSCVGLLVSILIP
jgi:hypothetical protein